VSEAFGADQHHHQKRHERVGWIDPVRRFPDDGHMPANLLDHTNLAQIRNENGNSAEGSYRSLGLTQDHALARQHSGDFPRNCFVRGICLHPSVVASPYEVCTLELRNSG
jgi:hypothetical protein